MQWDKVKNVLIGILLVVNLFLLGNLGFKIWQNYSRSAGLDADLRTLVNGYGSALSEDFRLPDDVFLPELSLDRSRSDEENIASVMLGADMERSETEDGTVRFSSADGTVTWYADGRVNGVCPMIGETPESEADAVRTQVPVRVGTFRRGRDGFRHGSDGHADRPGRRPAGAQPRADADDERGRHGDGFRYVELWHALYYGHGTRRGVPRG